MAQPTFTDLFDNNTDFINSAVFDNVANTLTITFAQSVTAAQAFAAVMQSGQQWLVSNTDQSVNLAVSTPTRNTSTRNGVSKDQININFQVYAPATNPTFDPSQI